MREFGEALKAAALVRGVFGLTAIAVVALVAIIGLTFFAPVNEIAKYVLIPVELIMFLVIPIYVIRRTPRTPPGVGEHYFEMLAERGAVYGDQGQLTSLEQILNRPAIANPKRQMLPPGEGEEETK